MLVRAISLLFHLVSVIDTAVLYIRSRSMSRRIRHNTCQFVSGPMGFDLLFGVLNRERGSRGGLEYRCVIQVAMVRDLARLPFLDEGGLEYRFWRVLEILVFFSDEWDHPTRYLINVNSIRSLFLSNLLYLSNFFASFLNFKNTL